MFDERDAGHSALMTFLCGAATGAALALLFAPQSGRETREKLREFGRKSADTMKDGPAAVGDAFARAARAAQTTFMETIRDRMHIEEKVDGGVS